MTCGCDKGDNKKACDKNFTRAVVKSIDPERLVEFHKVVVPASLGDDIANPPLVGKYCNVLLYYEANDQVYIYSSDGIPTRITVDVEALKKQIKKVADDLETETEDRKAADQEIWTEIETIEASSDVVDVVGTYAELEAYDTSKLHANDLIKVLQDETRDDAITYYRWNGSAFTYVGAEGPYYTASETDALLDDKQDKLIAGSNIQIASDGKTISATDTTYSAFTGATSVLAGASGLVPAPAAGDDAKFLKGDGTWDAVSGANYTAGTGIDITNDIISIDNTVVQEKLTAGSNISINGATISATDTTYSAFVGATSSVAGSAGLVPAPTTADPDKFLKGDGTWGSAAAEPTKFYSLRPSHSGAGIYLYKDSARTTYATYQDVVDALQSGNGVDFVILGDGVTYDQHNIACTYYYDNIGYAPDYYLSITFTSAGSYWNCALANDFSNLSSNARLYWYEQKYNLPTAASSTLGGVKVGSNLTISSGVLSANTLAGTDGVSDGTAGYAPAPLAADAGKYLKSDGTWATLPAANNISSNDWTALWQ